MYVFRFVPYSEHVAPLSLMDAAVATLCMILYFDKLLEICVLVSTDCNHNNQYGDWGEITKSIISVQLEEFRCDRSNSFGKDELSNGINLQSEYVGLADDRESRESIECLGLACTVINEFTSASIR